MSKLSHHQTERRKTLLPTRIMTFEKGCERSQLLVEALQEASKGAADVEQLFHIPIGQLINEVHGFCSNNANVVMGSRERMEPGYFFQHEESF